MSMTIYETCEVCGIESNDVRRYKERFLLCSRCRRDYFEKCSYCGEWDISSAGKELCLERREKESSQLKAKGNRKPD
jgi:hypothetical protein